MSRRAMVLLVVMVVLAVGAMTGLAAMALAQAQLEACAAAVRRTRTRAAAWSGIQAVCAELAAQRASLLRGEAPRVTLVWDGFEAESAFVPQSRSRERLIYRLQRRDDGRGRAGDGLVAEAGKLSVNDAPLDMLARLPGVPSSLLPALGSARARGRLQSALELIEVDPLSTPALTARVEAAADGRARDASDSAGASSAASAGARPLLESLTVFSFEPNVQVGIGSPREDVFGEPRMLLSGAWSEELGRRIEARFGGDVAAAARRLFDEKRNPKRDSELVAILRGMNIAPREWPMFLDAFTTDDGPYRPGRVDLLSASEDVLACVPGIDRSAAGRLVFGRARLDPDLRATVAWPILTGVLTEDQFQLASDFLCSRCLQWRATIESGFVPMPSDGAAPDFDSLESAPLLDRVAFDVVFDLAGPTPRLAYLRETTLLEAAQELAAIAPLGGSGAAPAGYGVESAAAGTGELVPTASPVDMLPERDESVVAPASGPPSSRRAARPDGRVGRWTTGGAGDR
ncbi:MAG: hypothetical protein JNM07_06985 [Phycisphaerae bacterium]|nr:hypothetical protein [Phycisphaerae bacterium]